MPADESFSQHPAHPHRQLASIAELDMDTVSAMATTLLPMLWAAYNSIPATLFFIYIINTGALLEVACVLLQLLGGLLAAAAVATLWFIA